MKERGELNIELARARAEILRPVLSKHAGRIEAMEPVARREYVDLFMVYLGLKAVAVPMTYVGQYDNAILADMYAALPQQEADTQFAIWEFGDGMHCIWNRQLVRKTIEANSDLGDYSYLLDGQDNENEIAYRYRFVNTLENLNSSGDPEDATMEGLLYGIPRSAAETFAAFLPEAQELIERVWENANQTDYPPSIGEVGHFPDTKARLLTLAQDTEEDNLAVLLQIEQLRNAEVPGFQYATFGDATRREEAALTALWEELHVAEAVNALFAEPRPLRRGFLQ